MNQEIWSKMKRCIAMILSFVMVIQICQSHIIVSKADSVYEVVVNVVDQGTFVGNAAVSVVLADGSKADLEKSGNVYRAGIVSENAVAGSYTVDVSCEGYADYSGGAEFALSGTTLSATVDIGANKLYTISGVVKENTDAGKKLGSVAVNAKDTPYSAQTNADGEYKLSVPKGTYTLVFTKDGYKTRQIYRNALFQG